MFALKQPDGTWVMSVRTGKRMVWSERRLARRAAKILGKRDGTFYTVTDA